MSNPISPITELVNLDRALDQLDSLLQRLEADLTYFHFQDNKPSCSEEELKKTIAMVKSEYTKIRQEFYEVCKKVN